LSLCFLALVCVNGLFKFYINTYKGRLGERMLRRMRFDLIDKVLRFPMVQFRRVKPAEVATMVKDEVEPLGGFIGDAFVQPVFLGGQAITAMAFIMLQSFWLGLIAGGIVLAQALIIPRLRRRLIELGRQRQLTARDLAGRVGEIVEGVGNIHVNDTSNYERADISARLGKIFTIRYEIFQRKFFVKFLNNFLAQLTPFLFYLVGGYFALTGRMDIGQLVAVIAAYKDLPSPIKELIDWDQQRLDVQVKYTQVIEQFTVDDLIDEKLQELVPGEVPALADGYSVSNLVVADESGANLVERVSLDIGLNQKLAVVGGLNSGAEHFAEALPRLLRAKSGKVSLNTLNVEDLSEAVIGRRIGFVPAEAALFHGSVRDNIVYALKHAPLQQADYDSAQRQQRDWEMQEAIRTGNSPEDVKADWIDYQAAGATGPHDLPMQVHRVFKIVGLDQDMLGLGLRGNIDPASNQGLTDGILEARNGLSKHLTDPEYAGLVEQFDPASYSEQATIGENLLFGTPVNDELSEDKLGDHPYLLKILAEEGLDQVLFDMGKEIAETAIELFADLAPDHPFFERLSFMSAEQIPDYQVTLARVQQQTFKSASSDDRALIMRLPFLYIEPRHRLSLVDDDLRQRILTARARFRDELPEQLKSAIEFYDPRNYNRAGSIQDNILAGRIAYGVAGGPERIMELIQSVLEEHELHGAIFEVGLDFNVGSGGKRLSAGQRQKIMLARALLKRPDILIINRSLSALDKGSQFDIARRVLEDAGTGQGYGVVWVLANAQIANLFDNVVVMSDGQVAEQGPPDELMKKQGAYAQLVA
ncbi:MAG: ABC transporter ATP-binding protein/permease, partial [Hyphomicrobiales bacterium]|nr:ABC transporter ATP-binding protein/permease [Hyphomicrobiales bacterium]